MSERDDLTDRVADLVHAAKLGNFGMEWTRWNSANQAEHIIALVRADERTRIREALLAPEVVGLKAEQWRLAIDASEFDEAVVTMERQLAAIGLTEEQPS